MILPRHAVIGFLLTLEGELDHHGWDNDQLPRIARMCVHDDQMCVHDMSIEWPDDIGQFLLFLGQSLTHDPSPEVANTAREIADDGFYGIFFVAEAHHRETDQDEPAEVRIICAVDIEGRAYRIERIRDTRKIVIGEALGSTGGRIFEGLRLVVLGASRYLPGDHDPSGLLEYKPLSEEEDQELEEWRKTYFEWQQQSRD